MSFHLDFVKIVKIILMLKKKYTILFGGTKNFGDFLYFNRAIKLIKKYKKIKDDEFLHLYAFKNLNDDLCKINKTKCLIICGGPGLMINLYPGKYPLIKDLNDIKVPIFFLASGWYGFPGDSLTVNEYVFTKSTIKLFNRIKKNKNLISVRDFYSKKVLSKNGFYNVLNTGCPGLYDLNNLKKSFGELSYKRILFTTPADKTLFKQSEKILYYLRNKFKSSKITCSFHRGIENQNSNDVNLINFCKQNKIEVIDVSKKFSEQIYNKFNFHIGYRVHGHYYFLSKKKYSVLIEEDGRGSSGNLTFKTPSIKAFERSKLGKIVSIIFRNYYLSDKLRKMNLLVSINVNIINDIDNVFKKINFKKYYNLIVNQKIQTKFKVMKKFLATLP